MIRIAYRSRSSRSYLLNSFYCARSSFTFTAAQYNLRYWWLLVGSSLLLIMLLTGCSSEPKLTVIDHTATVPAQTSISLSSLDRLEHVYGRTWLTADEIIIERNTRLIVHNAATGAERELTPGRQGVQLLAETSPDGRYVFFTEGVPNDRYTITGHILDTTSGIINNIGKLDMINEMHWADDTHLISGTPDTGLQKIDLQGQQTLLPLQGANTKDSIMLVQQVGQTIYFVSGSALNRVQQGDVQATPIATDVWDFNVAPDGQSIVIQQVGHKQSEPSKLIVIDANGKTVGTVAEGTLLGRPAWSPDGNMIAFSIYQESQQGMKGLYIFNRSTGTTTPITTQFQAYNSSIRWSPDSRRLSLYTEDNGVMTALIGINMK
ncbi:WD40 repeat domain-containing protein [Paenibacillus campi]|uniref:WD40 repeat domain-containing protein n=1 Tax=Paenibacillus campi TaxID=3106031 RepID=UPI002B0010E5|nr:WD40 repeat domain-containing protein [Paenibacillus sp. SGZ-1014]